MRKIIIVCSIVLVIVGAVIFGAQRGINVVNTLLEKLNVQSQEPDIDDTNNEDMMRKMFEQELDNHEDTPDAKDISKENIPANNENTPNEDKSSKEKENIANKSDAQEENTINNPSEDDVKEPPKNLNSIERVNKKVYVTAKIGLNIRTGNSTDYKIVTAVPCGTELSVIGICQNNWLLIDYKGQHLYVCGKYTKDEKSESVDTPKPASIDTTDDASGSEERKPSTPKTSDVHWDYSRTGLVINIDKHKENGLVYWVANVYTENPEKDINTAFAGGSYAASLNVKKKTSTMAGVNNAVLAINGDACGFRGPGSAYQNPCLIRNGRGEYELIRDKNIGEMCGLAKNGELIIFNPVNYSSNQDLLNIGITDTWWFDCALVKDGQIPQSLLNAESHLSKAPYTAIGQKDNNNFIFIVVDGRGSNGSTGVTYTGMARLMQQYGARTAYQLDGGGSSTIWFDGMVLNKPSDGSERAISDIIYIKR